MAVEEALDELLASDTHYRKELNAQIATRIAAAEGKRRRGTPHDERERRVEPPTGTVPSRWAEVRGAEKAATVVTPQNPRTTRGSAA